MLSLNRICIYILMLGILLLIPSIKLISFLDELLSFSILAVALFDCFVNGSWKKYGLLWTLTGFLTFYAIYSVLFLEYNTPKYIIIDWIIELKPFIPFAVFLAIGPQFSERDKRWIRFMASVNSILVLIILCSGNSLTTAIFTNPTFGAQITFISAILYLYSSRDRLTGHISRRAKMIVLAMLCVGLISLKAKYFATFIPSVYLLTAYKPGTFRNFNIRHAVVLIALGATILIATWSKIQYYFLAGGGDGSFDPSVVQSFARPVMYLTSGQILVDHFPFGTGLASFGTAASSMNYSNVYFEYGIHNVHGISWRSEENFICDSFYPSLAQYGIIGLILFIAFWFYVYHFLRVLIREDSELYKAQFIAGAMIIMFLLFESVAATTLTSNSGMITMCLLGMSCAFGRRILEQQQTASVTAERLLRKI